MLLYALMLFDGNFLIKLFEKKVGKNFPTGKALALHSALNGLTQYVKPNSAFV